jgi:ABC-type transport system involved in multi-copper enzyme maturation permease subunit
MSLLSLPANTLLAAAAPSSLQWNMTILVGLLALAALFAVLYTTRAGIIARATTKEAIRQPVFILMLVVALVMLVINTFLPFFTLGDDVKMLKDCGLATILICSLLIAVWTSSTSIADEIEGKTAMTLLSKPINRRQFIVGKYLGIVNAVMALMVPLSICLLALIYYKVGYDAKESSKVDPLHAERMVVVLQTVPGLLLILLEVAVLSAVSVAISTRLPMIVNLVTCFSIFVVGHLTGVLVQSNVFEGRLEFVQFMAMAIATVLPALELFNISAAVATDSVVPPVYLGTAAIYCAAYCTAAILLAFILFEDRDLA